jgi:hypothetical protein
MTVVRATTATRVNSAGLVELVPYNLLQYSEQFNNGVWGLFSSGTGVNPIITANTTTAPNGTLTADTIVFNSGVGTTAADQSQMYQTFQRATGVTYTYSFYAKGLVGGEQVMVRHADGSSYTKLTLTNDWARYQVTETSAATGTGYLEMVIRRGLNEPMNASATFYIWGAQLEEGSYPTSYIPTTSAAVTRNADVISKTGISALLGAATGSAFVEFTGRGGDIYGFIPISLGVGLSNLAYLYVETNNRISAEFYQSGVLQAAIATGVSYYNSNNVYKAAFAWANNDFVLYINGTQIGTDSSGTAPTPTSIRIGNYNDPSYEGPNINSAILFPTRLTNAELAQLTT